MVYENEITVEVDTNLENLKSILINNKFKIKEEYDVVDHYMLRKDYKINENNLDILKNCILIRKIIEDKKTTNLLTYKYKEYNDSNEIIKQGKINCKVDSTIAAQELLEAIGYYKLIEINDHIIVYANEMTELSVQLVNNKHIYIEIEEKCNFIDKTYESIEDMKEEINKYQIPIKDNNYFVKKAEIELMEALNFNNK